MVGSLDSCDCVTSGINLDCATGFKKQTHIFAMDNNICDVIIKIE